jgi:1,2-diacylglycerol 3-alpha-glucosyltransferase
MTILHINGYFKEDVVYQENLLTIGQAELGHKIYLLTSCYEPEMKINRKKRKYPPGFYNYKNITVIRVSDFLEIKKNALVLLKNPFLIIRKIKPDIIYFHDVSPLLISAIFYKIFNPKVIYHIDFHSDEYNSLNSFLGKYYHFFWRMYFHYFKNFFAKFFCISPEVISFVDKYYKIPKDLLIHLPLPGETDSLINDPNIKIKARGEFNLDESNIVLVHTGKIPKGKDTLLVLNAFSNILDGKFRLLIAGSIDAHFEDIFSNALKNDKRIIYLGWLSPDKMKTLFYASDLLVQPGSLSNSFISAICCGLPILLNNTPQGQHLTSFGNGELIYNKNLSEVKYKIERIVQTEAYSRYKNNALKAAKIFHYLNIAKISLS